MGQPQGDAGLADVDVWWVGLAPPPGGLPRLAPLLSGPELDDVRRLRREVDATALALSRVALRGIVASYVGLPPAALGLDRRCARCGGGHGRPVLTNGPEGLGFSLARTAGHAVVAVGRCAVGVDVERVRPLDDVIAVADLLADDERAALVALPEARRLRAFLTVWTRKEAYLKARGEGLRRDLRDFVVTPAGHPPGVRSSAAGDAGAWTLAELATPDDELVATLAAAAPGVRVRTATWSL